jgi:hypothetical protein
MRKEADDVDVARASDKIDALIDKRAAGRGEATAEEMAWKTSVRRHNAKLRRQRQGEWYCYFSALADSLRASAEEFERRAERLLEAEEGGGDAP